MEEHTEKHFRTLMKYTPDALQVKEIKKYVYDSSGTCSNPVIHSQSVKGLFVTKIKLINIGETIENSIDIKFKAEVIPFKDIDITHWAVDHIKFLKDNKIISEVNENYNPENYITVSESSKIVAGVSDIVSSTDLDSDSNWQSTVMDALKKEGIIDPNEFPTSEFSKPIKRKEFVKMIIKALNIEVGESTSSNFSDVKNDSYKKYIEKASELKIVNGYGNGTFGPDNFIKRSELAKVIHNTLLSL